MLTRKLVAVTGAVVLGMGATWAASTPATPEYKSWRTETPKPLAMDPTIAVMCAVPVGGYTTGEGVHYTQKKYFYKVFVNPKGAHSLQDGVKFPEGSTIVKEKLTKGGNKFNVELLTVMLKGKKGSNPKQGDWDFYVAKPDGTRLSTPEQVENCVSCHRSEMTTDMVFRTYVMDGPVRK